MSPAIVAWSNLPVCIREVFQECARRHNVKPGDLIGRGKRRLNASRARRDVSLALRKMGKSYHEIARYMGVDHASIVAQVKPQKVAPAPVAEKPWKPDESGIWAI